MQQQSILCYRKLNFHHAQTVLKEWAKNDSKSTNHGQFRIMPIDSTSLAHIQTFESVKASNLFPSHDKVMREGSTGSQNCLTTRETCTVHYNILGQLWNKVECILTCRQVPTVNIICDVYNIKSNKLVPSWWCSQQILLKNQITREWRWCGVNYFVVCGRDHVVIYLHLSLTLLPHYQTWAHFVVTRHHAPAKFMIEHSVFSKMVLCLCLLKVSLPS